MRTLLGISVIAVLLGSGCAHARVERGATPTATTGAPAGDDAAAAAARAAAAEIARLPALGPLYFERDSTTLTPASRDALAAIAEWMGHHPAHLRIAGHCDETGTDEYNLGLGDRRANAVAGYLERLGVEAARLDTISYGEEVPADDGHDEAANAANRRAELVIGPADPADPPDQSSAAL